VKPDRGSDLLPVTSLVLVLVLVLVLDDKGADSATTR
jgi:hypothetical protein